MYNVCTCICTAVLLQFRFFCRYVYKLVELAKVLINVDPDQRPSIDNVIERLESIQNIVENRV